MAAERAITAYRFGRFVLDAADRVLVSGKKRIFLTPKEFDTLHVLVARAGHLVRKEELLRAVWPDHYVSEGSLARNVSVLRKHLGADAIQTIPKHGYCFALPVEAAHELFPGSETVRRVAVLPFSNMSKDESLDAWIEAVCEETIQSLVHSIGKQVPVISLATGALWQETGKTAQQVAEDLRVEYLLAGWVRKDADSMRLHLELVNARTFTFVWVGSYPVLPEKPESLPASIAGRIAEAAKAVLLPGSVTTGSGGAPAAEASQD